MHIHKYEKIWIGFGLVSLFLFVVVMAYMAFAKGHDVSGGHHALDPTKVSETAPFDEPKVRKINEDTYEVNLVALAFGYQPNKIEVPVGKKIIFNVTSKDVIHSFSIIDSNVNMEIIPGLVSTRAHTFKKPGNYLVLCNEYCGAGHHMMSMGIEVVSK
jgi:cytochrome c oxidase subunit II